MDYGFIEKYNQPWTSGNPIRDLNPLSKLNLMIVLGLSPFVVQNYVYGFGMALLFIIISILAGCFRSFFSLYWKVLLLFGFFLFLVKAAFSPGEHVIFQIWGIRVTYESIFSGLNIVSLVLAFSGAFILFVKTTPMDEFTYMLEQKGVSHVVSFIILSSFQTITDLGQNAKIIMESQKARGIETEGNVFQRAKAYLPVIGPLILNAISSTEEKSIAMDARAFSAPVKHTYLMELPKPSIKEKIIVLGLDIIFVLLLIGRIVLWLL
ncbi:energy-coupling factor transporter transmembrane protein EcfT [Clostridiales bacterium COT073_COT-073]|nr:energy-coupling factor transporter transmembrane protein EcfT [Clostridiales bacterium COT073_COT-073]